MHRAFAIRRAAAVVAVGIAALGSGCSDRDAPLTGVSAGVAAGASSHPDIPGALRAQRRYTPGLMHRGGVLGTAVGLLPDGRAAVRVFLEHPGVTGLPRDLDGIPVDT